jgi:hypothetical protein
MLIMAVFDPLAVLLLIAANMSLTQPKREPQPTKEPESVGFMAQEVANVLPEIVATSDEKEMVSVDYNTLNSMMIKSIQELNGKIDNPFDKYAYLKQPFKHFENLKPMVAPKEEPEPKPPDNMVRVHANNVFVLDHLTGETMPPIITKYDYDANFAFVEKENK